MIKNFFERVPYGGDAEFSMFSLTHLLTFLICIIIVVIFMKMTPKIRTSKYEKHIRYSIAIVMLLTNINIYLYAYKYSLAWYEYLPEATCGWAIYFGSIGLITKNRTMLLLTLFWGYGAVFSLLGPTILEGVDKFNFYQFFLRHILIVVAGFYMVKVLEFKVYKKDVLTYIKITLAMVFAGWVVSYIVNDPDNLNMFYVLKPGMNGTPLSWLHEIYQPLYLVVWLLFAILVGYLYVLPFYEKEK